MKKLYIDLDGVVCDFDKAILALCADLIHMNSIERENTVERLIKNNPSFFENLPPVDGAIESVQKMFELYDVYFLSTPMWAIPESYSGKRIWIEKHFGELSKKRLILTHRKDLIIGEYLIDDRIMHGVSKFMGTHIHFGTAQFPDWETTFNYLKNKN
jgi:5'-nucleotidase